MTLLYRTKYATPVLNTSQSPFQTPLGLDEQGRILCIETLLAPGSFVRIVEQKKPFMAEIKTPHYSSSQSLYLDTRFLEPSPLPISLPSLPSAQTILDTMKHLLHTRYFWGGSWPAGIEKTFLLSLYPSLDSLEPEQLPDALCQGIDCSGLLHYATHQLTPRNTSQLISFGEEIPWTSVPLSEVEKQIKPLDLLVYSGHVLIVLQERSANQAALLIESRIGKGVCLSSFQDRFREIEDQTKELQKPLYIRRWHPECL